MELEITKKELNPLLGRSEIEAKARLEKTPSYDEVKKEISDKLKKPAELIVIKHIYQKYGQPESTINALIYDNQESFNKFEMKKEKKAEEKKEESKEEKKE